MTRSYRQGEFFFQMRQFQLTWSQISSCYSIGAKILIMDQKRPKQVSNLFELPNCSICLQELMTGLTSLACGHVFHLHCIDQHNQHSNLCPNCKKRNFKHEWHQLIYHATASLNADLMIRQLFDQLSDDQKRQSIVMYERFQTISSKLILSNQQLKDKAGQLDSLQRLNHQQAISLKALQNQNKQLIASNRTLTQDFLQSESKQRMLNSQLNKLNDAHSALSKRQNSIDRYQQAMKMLDCRQSEFEYHLSSLTDEESRKTYLLDVLGLQQSRYRQVKEQLNQLKMQLHQEKGKSQNLSSIIKNLRNQNDRVMQRIQKYEKKFRQNRRDDQSSMNSSIDRDTPKLELTSLPMAGKIKPLPQKVPQQGSKKNMHFSLRQMLQKRKV